MKRKRLYYFLFLVFSISTQFYPVGAQVSSGNIVQYTEQDGLPGAQVNNIIQDKSGYIWLGTINGLARFDGYEFKRFYANPNDPGSIQGMIVWSLFEDQEGIIWIGASPEHINAYDPVSQTFKHYEFKELVTHPDWVEIGVSTIADNGRGRVYFGVSTLYGDSISNGLLYLDRADSQIKNFEIPDGLHLSNIHRSICDKKGNIWLGTSGGLFIINSQNELSKFTLLDEFLTSNRDFVTDVKCDDQGHLWFISSRYRLIDFDPASGEYNVFYPMDLPSNNEDLRSFNLMALDQEDNIWIGSELGLGYFDSQTKGFNISIEESQQLEGLEFRNMMIDSFGSLWMGTSFDGLYKYAEGVVLKSYSPAKGDPSALTPGWVNHVLELDDGRILITSSGQGGESGLNFFDPAIGSIEPHPYNTFSPSIDHFFGIYQNETGDIWASTLEGLKTISLKTLKTTPLKIDGIPDGLLINDFFLDKEENFWLGSMDGLFKRGKEDRSFKRYDISQLEESNGSSNEVISIAESPKHGLWLQTSNGLYLYRYDTDKIERHGFDRDLGSFISQDINSLYVDPNGTVWVGIWQGGLSKYYPETRKVETYTRNEGLPSMSIQGILSDHENNALWLSTFEGLSRFNLDTEQFNNYSITDGAQSQLYSDNAHLKTSKGLFIFGGANGINVFTAKEVDDNSLPPIVFLTGLKLFNKLVIPGENSVLDKPINETSEIILSHDQNNITIDFMALHFADPSKNHSEFILENYETDWRESGSQHSAFYPQLPPGKYTFRVKASNNNGVWNDDGVSLIIIINKPWWKALWAFGIYGLLFVLCILAANRYFRNRLIRKERERNSLRELEQAKEIEKAYRNLEQSHEALKATQSQLIESEKMASLGELTAGIAHEIQNPLNFVNNFAEVSIELLDEMKDEVQKGDFDEVIQLSDDIKQNLEKINHHGKRADGIVKAMLQHSRTSSGQKEPTDLNALTDEFLRLSYHGLRAKDKSFNASIQTDFDSSIGLIDLIPQEIGRVILNLFTNAFYAVNEKKKAQKADFEPLVVARTKKLDQQVEIRIKDNGIGIPQAIIDKIFHPFFTTKPAGEGTGLGLSMSYDIITKGHSGELRVNTLEGEFTEFIIRLPLQK